MQHPRISIIMPTLNQGDFIESAIRSVLLQDYPSLEFFVLDGGSSDRTVEVLERYTPHLDRWVSEPDGGQAAAINRGVGWATGEIVAWLNSDDLLLPGALAAVAELYAREPDAAAWVGGCHRVDPNGRILSTVLPRGLDRESMADWGHRGWFYQPACFISARAWRRAGPIDERLHYAFDLDLWLRLSTIGRLMGTDRVIAAALIHPAAKTQAFREVLHAEVDEVQRRHGFEAAAIRQRDRLRKAKRIPSLIGRVVERWRWIRAGRPTLARRLGSGDWP